jgi:protoporphyrinogen/coproporphyrinogen III oxidase
MERVDVAIIGAGIAGLALAERLRTRAPELTVRLFEASDRPGGKIRTERIAFDGGRFIVESGPDAILAQKPWALDLIAELGLSDQLIPINRMPNSTAILKGGRQIDLPDGVALVAPTKIWPFVRTGLLSWPGKIRAARDFVTGPRAGDGDESLGSFVTRRFGREVLDWLAEPLAAGIYNADPDQLSLRATFPQLANAERTSGSVICGLRKSKKPTPAKPNTSTFVTLRDGMQSLTDALADRARPILRTNAPATSILPDEAMGYVVRAGTRDVLTSHVVLTVPAAQAAALVRGIAPEATRELSTLRSNHAGTISLAYRTADIPRPLRGYGLVIPKREGRPINAITIASRKFDCRAPDGWTLIRVFFGGYRNPETMRLSDGDLHDVVAAELRSLMGITSPPEFDRIQHWPQGSPQYDVGHLDRIARIDAALPEGIALIGSPYRGVGIADIVHQSWQLAEQLMITAPGTPVLTHLNASRR